MTLDPLIEVDRAISELRRGAMVRVYDSNMSFVALAVDALTPANLNILTQMGTTAPKLVLTGNRLNVLGIDKSDRPAKKSYKSDSRPATSTWRADTEKVERTERSEKYEGKRPAFKKASGPKKFAKKAPAKKAPVAKGTFKKAGPNKNAGKPKPRMK